MRLFSLWILLFATVFLFFEYTIVIKSDPALLYHIEICGHGTKIEDSGTRRESLDLKLADQREEIAGKEWSHPEVRFVHSIDLLQFVLSPTTTLGW